MFRMAVTACVSLVLVACAGAPRTPSSDAAEVARILAAVQAAGAREQSGLEVTPLADPGVDMLRQQARSAALQGHYDEAEAKLAQALRLHPDSPPIVQQQAELALRRGDWASAEALARRSWQLGPRLGSLCAENWQTVLEMRRLAGDEVGMQAARDGLASCHVEEVHRY